MTRRWQLWRWSEPGINRIIQSLKESHSVGNDGIIDRSSVSAQVLVWCASENTGSSELCRAASESAGIPVKQRLFQ